MSDVENDNNNAARTPLKPAETDRRKEHHRYLARTEPDDWRSREPQGEPLDYGSHITNIARIERAPTAAMLSKGLTRKRVSSTLQADRGRNTQMDQAQALTEGLQTEERPRKRRRPNQRRHRRPHRPPARGHWTAATTPKSTGSESKSHQATLRRREVRA